MAINLEKGGRLNLSKTVPGLKNILVGLGWDTNRTDTGGDFDLDVTVLMTSNGKIPDENYVIYFNNLTSPCGAVKHMGDNRTGEGEGDDEEVKIDLSKLPENIDKLVFVVNIYEAEQRKQNFGMVDNSYIRLVNEETGEEILRYDLGEDFSTETGVNFGEIYKAV